MSLCRLLVETHDSAECGLLLLPSFSAPSPPALPSGSATLSAQHNDLPTLASPASGSVTPSTSTVRLTTSSDSEPAVEAHVNQLPKLDLRFVKDIFAIRTNRLIFLQALPGEARDSGHYFLVVCSVWRVEAVTAAWMLCDVATGTVPWAIVVVFINDFLTQV